MIPRFLMILGIKGIGENVIICIVLSIVMFIYREQSEPDRRKILNRLELILFPICAVSNTAWVITGCVWTFGVKNRVQSDDIESANYCHYKLQQNLIKLNKRINPVQHTILL